MTETTATHKSSLGQDFREYLHEKVPVRATATRSREYITSLWFFISWVAFAILGLIGVILLGTMVNGWLTFGLIPWLGLLWLGYSFGTWYDKKYGID